MSRRCWQRGFGHPADSREGAFHFAFQVLPSLMTCGIVRNSRSLVAPCRLTSVVISFLPIPFATQGPFPPSALSDFIGITDLSATLATQPAPRGVPVAVCSASSGLPVFHRPSPSTRASASTPAETIGASLGVVMDPCPIVGDLPPIPGESASASPFSRPARRSLGFRPAWSLNRPMAALLHRSASARVVISMTRRGYFQPERWLSGGIRTRKMNGAFHGAQEPGVVGDQMQTGILLFARPTDPGIPNSDHECLGRPANQHQSGVVDHRYMVEILAVEVPERQRVVLGDQPLPLPLLRDVACWLHSRLRKNTTEPCEGGLLCSHEMAENAEIRMKSRTLRCRSPRYF